MLIVNCRHLEHALAEYVAHFNHHRPHRTLDQTAPLRPSPHPQHNPTSASGVAIGLVG
jgi:hypothetical protein